jgi:UDP-glucuronate decarboxylase
MDSPDDVTGPINIGDPNEISVLELAQRIIQKTGTGSGVELCDLPSDDPKQRQPDITRARDILGWEPTVGLDDGLDRTIDYFREFLRDGEPR